MEELRKRHSGLTLDVHIIKTTGDRMQDVSLAQIGGKGAFVKELEEALLERRIDLAIHSMKDVPALLPEGLVIAAMLEREDPRDVLISKGNFKLERIPPRARIGTGSLRRGSQLKNIYMDVEIVPIRGNLDTRIKKIERENLDGIIVAAAGLKRMGWQDRASQYIPAEIMTPAVGQGALGVEVRSDDDVKEIVSVLNDETDLHRGERRAGLSGRLRCRLPGSRGGLRENRERLDHRDGPRGKSRRPHAHQGSRQGARCRGREDGPHPGRENPGRRRQADYRRGLQAAFVATSQYSQQSTANR